MIVLGGYRLSHKYAPGQPNIPNLPENHTGPRTEIVIQSPKTKNVLRSLPLLPAAIQDLLVWRSVQEQEAAAAGPAYSSSGFIVTNALGGCIEPRTFKDYYNQILDLAGLRHSTFHALRHPYVKLTTKEYLDFYRKMSLVQKTEAV